MNKTQEDKLQRFMNDAVMADTVYQVLLDSFLVERPNQDVYVLAASRLSIDFLKQGWKELERYARKEKAETPIRTQEGL